MNKVIAARNRFELRYKSYVTNHTYTTHDIEIVEWAEESPNYCYTIADFDDEGQLVSCGDRLLNAIHDMVDLESISALSKIGSMIIESDEVDITNR